MADSDDENFVTFGCSLDPLDEENLPRKKPVTIEDQYALDAQGRRRFHGAFTGGFSAGYFNSVGTRDGWRPRQFKSSRSSKTEGVLQRAEDFMDEEDTGEFGIAPTAIRANSDFADHGRRGAKRERARQNNDGPIPGVPVLKELLKPVKDTVGVTLLKKMGWRPGQGIGPRVTKREKTKTREKNEKLKIYGCSLPNQRDKTDELASDGSSDETDEILFVPDDYEPFRCNPKDNYFGIGYTGLDRRPVLSGHVNLFETPAFQLEDKKKKLSIRGQAFGVGAFEAEDEDIYQHDDMSRYDFALGTPETKSKSRWSGKNDAETSRINCLEGFTPAKNRLERTKFFDAPELPKESKALSHTVRKSRFNSPIEPPAISDGRKRGLGRHDLNATDRSIILGESNSTGQNSRESTKNVNESNSEPRGSQPAVNIISRTLNLHGKEQVEKTRQQDVQGTKGNENWLEKLTCKSFVKGGIEGSDPGATGSLKKLQEFRGNICEASASQFSRPFPTDIEKQRRFEKFVELTRREEREKFSSLQPLSMTEWERDHEREEFEQAARLLEKSLLDVAAVGESSNSLKLYSDEKFVAGGAEEAAGAATKTLDDRMKDAARMKLFGKLTREREPWQPASLVCKRFNIPEPRTGCANPDNTTKNKRYSVFDSLEFRGSYERFEHATDTSATFKEPELSYRPKENEEKSATSSKLDVFDIDATPGRSTEKTPSFEASYDKIFGRRVVPLAASNELTWINPDEPRVSDARSDNTPTKDNFAEKKDLFKAIFLSSSSSSSEGSESEKSEEEEDDSEAVKSLLIGKAPGELNLERNTSPPRGIFAMLDLESLTKPGKSTGEEKLMDGIVAEQLNNDHQDMQKTDDELRPDMYGPVLPSKSYKSAETSGNEEASFSKDCQAQKTIFKSVVVTRADSNEDRIKGKWVERTKVKKSKKEKHKHRHKEKERSRHKHKKKDKR